MKKFKKDLIFALGMLPVTAAAAVFSLLFGLLYRKQGLPCSMAAHLTCHVTFRVLPALF